LAEVEAAQQPVELFFGQRDGFSVILSRPFEALLFQALVPETETAAVPVEDLQLVAALIAEDKHRRVKHRQAHRLLNNQAQAVDGFAEVDRVAVQIDSVYADKHAHGRGHDSAITSAASQVGEVPAGKCNWQRPYCN